MLRPGPRLMYEIMFLNRAKHLSRNYLKRISEREKKIGQAQDSGSLLPGNPPVKISADAHVA